VGSFVLASVGDEELAEEITARVFLTVVARFDQCRASPAGWLWAIVRTELAGHFRAAGRVRPADPGRADPADRPEQRLQQDETHTRMHAALGRLSDDQQRIIYMKFFQDMPNVAIARATGLSPGTVGVRVHRTLKALRALMDGAGR